MTVLPENIQMHNFDCFYEINLKCLGYVWLSSDSFLYYQSHILSPFRWTPIDTLSKACSIMKNYSSTEGREGILVNVTFVVNSLVILSEPNQRRILLCLRLITNRGGQQTLYIAIDHVWRQVYRLNTHSKWKMGLFFMTASCRKKKTKTKKIIFLHRLWELQLCLALYQMNTLLGIFDQRCRETKHIYSWCFYILMLLAAFFFYTHLIETSEMS